MKKTVGFFAGWRRFATSRVGEFARYIAWVASRAGAQVRECADTTPAFVGSLDHCTKKLKADY
jgi:hypothetical protein